MHHPLRSVLQLALDIRKLILDTFKSMDRIRKALFKMGDLFFLFHLLVMFSFLAFTFRHVLSLGRRRFDLPYNLLLLPGVVTSTDERMNEQELTVEPCLKPLEGVVKLLGRQWTVPIVILMGKFERGLRYSEIREFLVERNERDISDSTLSRKLQELTDLRLVTRRSFDEIPPRVEYELSDAGRQLFQILSDIGKWARDGCHTGQLKISKY